MRRHAGGQSGRQAEFRWARCKLRTGQGVERCPDKPAGQDTAFVYPLVAPIGVILGQHQLLPGLIPVRQLDGLFFRADQQALNGLGQFGFRRILVVLLQVVRDGARLIGGKASDQAHQHQQPGNQGERDMLDGDGVRPFHRDGVGCTCSRNLIVWSSRSNSCSPSMKWLPPCTITMGTCRCCKTWSQPFPSVLSASPMTSCTLTGACLSAVSRRGWSQRTYDSSPSGVEVYFLQNERVWVTSVCGSFCTRFSSRASVAGREAPPIWASISEAPI